MAGTRVIMETSLGSMTIELDEEKAPVTTANFLGYVDEGFYNNTIFHRVISNFMIQGGGFESGMKQQKKTRAAIVNESGNGLSNTRGTIAMARLPAPDTATAQFFINVVDNLSLDRARYCVFGKVVEGMDVVDKIKKVQTTTKSGHQDVPTVDVVINSVRRA
jgi:cyclophilin family peptidyl-prolyl cis-trans isomerase